MSASTVDQLERVSESGWRRGLGNLLQGEVSAWFASSRWWKQLALWVALVNGMMAIMVYATAEAAKVGQQGPPLVFMYGIFGGLCVIFGVLVIMQQVLVGEKRAGTAAWVLSKPVTRTAFVVSRLAVNATAILLTAVIGPGLLFYLTLGLFSDLGWLAPAGYLAGLSMYAVNTLYWITLVLMLGTLLDAPGGVIGVPLAVLFGFWMGPDLFPPLLSVSPLMLVFSPAPDVLPALATSFVTGTPVFSWWPLIATVVSCVVFVAVAIWRFNRQEF